MFYLRKNTGIYPFKNTTFPVLAIPNKFSYFSWVKKLWVFLILSFFSFKGDAALNRDSLYASLPPVLKDTSDINRYLKVAKAFIDFNFDSTQNLASKAVKKSESLAYTSGLIRGINLLGNCAQRKGDFEEAMKHYEQVKAMALEAEDDKGMAMALNNIGIIYTQGGQYNRALAAYFEAIDYEKKIDNQKGIAEGYNNVGVVHYHMGDMENTLAYLKKSILISESLNDYQILKKGYMNVGAIHLYRKEYDEALRYFGKGLDIAKELSDLADITIAYHNMANVYDEMGNYKKSEELYLQALGIHEKFGNRRGVALEYNNLGSLFKNQKKFSRALEYFQKSIAISSQAGFLKILESSYAGLSELYASQNQHKRAYESLLVFIDLKDSLINEENAKAFAELRTKYETAEKEKALAEEQIKTEQLTAEKAQAELTAEKRTRLIFLLLAGIIIILLSSFAVIQRNKRKVQAEKDAALIRERDRGTQAVFTAQEEERKRISKDLHDGVGQQLSGIKMAFQKLGKELKHQVPERSQEIDKLSEIISESADEVRSISHQMMPKALSQFGLVEALEDLLNKAFSLSEIEYQFEYFGITERFKEQIEISLYRIVQELVNNIIKHSQATKVHVQLFKNQGKLILIVEDNGKGIGKDLSSDGHGLLNIKTRLNPIHGEINLEPSPGSGTLATIRLPLS